MGKIFYFILHFMKSLFELNLFAKFFDFINVFKLKFFLNFICFQVVRVTKLTLILLVREKERREDRVDFKLFIEIKSKPESR